MRKVRMDRYAFFADFMLDVLEGIQLKGTVQRFTQERPGIEIEVRIVKLDGKTLPRLAVDAPNKD